MEPAAGLEPATRSLQNCCSTTELSWPIGLPSASFTEGQPVSSSRPWLRSGKKAEPRIPHNG